MTLINTANFNKLNNLLLLLTTWCLMYQNLSLILKANTNDVHKVKFVCVG